LEPVSEKNPKQIKNKCETGKPEFGQISKIKTIGGKRTKPPSENGQYGVPE
jgi:hypothetical protein